MVRTKGRREELFALTEVEGAHRRVSDGVFTSLRALAVGVP